MNHTLRRTSWLADARAIAARAVLGKRWLNRLLLLPLGLFILPFAALQVPDERGVTYGAALLVPQIIAYFCNRRLVNVRYAPLAEGITKAMERTSAAALARSPAQAPCAGSR